MLESAEGSKDDTMGVTKGARELCFTSFLNPCVAFRSVGPDSFLKTKTIHCFFFKLTLTGLIFFEEQSHETIV